MSLPIKKTYAPMEADPAKSSQKPSTSTGRLPAQDETDDRGTKCRRTKRKSTRNQNS